uniref:Uncharacterized protein n=1 Tax=Romanomermis culicivorax TaxID=13658 RepID=A0A915HHR2_ROMCU
MFLKFSFLLAVTHGAVEFIRKDVVRQFKGASVKEVDHNRNQVHVEPSVANLNNLDPNVQDLLGKWHLVYVSPSTATFYQSIPHCHVSYIYDENDRNDKFILWEAFKQSSSISINSSWISYKRSATKYSAGRYWLTMEHQFYPQQ